MTTRFTALVLAFLIVVQPGCGTILGFGLTTTMSIDSEPGAEVLVEGKVVGTAPCEIEMDNEQSSYRITVRKEGFKVRGVTVRRKASLFVIMSDVFLSVYTLAIPLIVDAAFGSWYYYPEKEFSLPLTPLVAVAAPAPVTPTPAPASPAPAQPAPTTPASKFCGECGVKLESTTAGFCAECGAKQ